MKFGLLSKILMVTLIFLNYSYCRKVKNTTMKLRGLKNLNKYKTDATNRKVVNIAQSFAKQAVTPHKAQHNSKRKFSRDNSGTSVKTFYASQKLEDETQAADKTQPDMENKLNRDNTDDDDESDADSKALDVVQKFVNDVAAARKLQAQKGNISLTEFVNVATAREAHQNAQDKQNVDNEDNCETDDVKVPDECSSNTSHSKTLGIAQKAANDAAAAHAAQQIAAEHASQQVKLQLADKALVSANAAEAAVAGKETIVEELQDEINHISNETRKAACDLATEQGQLHLALLTAEGSKNEVALLNKALERAQSNEQNAKQAAQCAQEDLLHKEQIIMRLKCYTDALKKRLQTANVDLQETKKVVQKGLLEACRAKANVANDKQRKAIRRKTKNKRVQHYYKKINVPINKYMRF